MLYRLDTAGVTLWRADTNGVLVEHVSTDPAQKVEERPYAEPGRRGNRLVDADNGIELAVAFVLD